MVTQISDSPTRPEFKHDIKESDARWLLSCSVTKITHHWKFITEDSTEDWIELHGMIAGKAATKKFPTRFFNDGEYFEFSPDHARLINPTWRGRQLRDDIEAIDKWEKKNSRELAEYKRLQKKFGANS